LRSLFDISVNFREDSYLWNFTIYTDHLAITVVVEPNFGTRVPENVCYDALPSGGALIVYESIIDDDRSKNAFGLMMSLNMLIETPGGFDYTGADCCGWVKEAGFSPMWLPPRQIFLVNNSIAHRRNN
jgi:O-methyltransferase domain